MEPHCYQHQNWIPSRKENWKNDYHKTTEKSPKQQIIKAQKMLLRFSWHPKILVSETKRGTPQTKHNSKYNQGLFYYIKDGKLQGLMLFPRQHATIHSMLSRKHNINMGWYRRIQGRCNRPLRANIYHWL